MTAPDRAPDEFEQRLKALEAERLRPVPALPSTERRRQKTEKDSLDDFNRRLNAFEKRLRRLGERHHGEPTPDTDAAEEAS